MLVGYARVSTQEQKPALQRQALKKEGCEKIFTEKASGEDLLTAFLRRRDDAFSCEPGDRSKDVENQTTGRACDVDALGQRSEISATIENVFNDVHQIAERSRQPAVLGDHDNVVLAKLLNQAVELWAFYRRA